MNDAVVMFKSITNEAFAKYFHLWRSCEEGLKFIELYKIEMKWTVLYDTTWRKQELTIKYWMWE